MPPNGSVPVIISVIMTLIILLMTIIIMMMIIFCAHSNFTAHHERHPPPHGFQFPSLPNGQHIAVPVSVAPNLARAQKKCARAEEMRAQKKCARQKTCSRTEPEMCPRVMLWTECFHGSKSPPGRSFPRVMFLRVRFGRLFLRVLNLTRRNLRAFPWFSHVETIGRTDCFYG